MLAIFCIENRPGRRAVLLWRYAAAATIPSLLPAPSLLLPCKHSTCSSRARHLRSMCSLSGLDSWSATALRRSAACPARPAHPALAACAGPRLPEARLPAVLLPRLRAAGQAHRGVQRGASGAGGDQLAVRLQGATGAARAARQRQATARRAVACLAACNCCTCAAGCATGNVGGKPAG